MGNNGVTICASNIIEGQYITVLSVSASINEITEDLLLPRWLQCANKQVNAALFAQISLNN